MSRCRNAFAGLLVATLLCAHAQASQFSTNMFLNGDYQNGIKSHPKQHDSSVYPSAGNIFLEHAIISRQASPFAAPTYLPPLEYLKCNNGQQCVRKEQCQGGYYTQQVPKIQNCSPATDICCTYRPPPTTTTTTTTTTTPKPYTECRDGTDCVQARDCRNGEIIAENYIKGQSRRCYAPEVCCRLPSTLLTEDGYVLHVPQNPLSLPTVRPTQPAPTAQYTPAPQPTPGRPQTAQTYLPPTVRPTPGRPQTPPSYVPSTPRPTSYYPQPTPTPARQPSQPPQRYTTSPPRQTQPTYTPTTSQPRYPTAPSRQPAPTSYPQPQPTQRYTTPAPRPTTPRPTSTNNYYLPPTTKVPSRPSTPDRYPTPTITNEYAPQPSNENPSRVPLNGSSVLSLPIFPKPTYDQSSRPIYSKCASALVCTNIDYCNSIGVISDVPIQLTPMQAAFRVPLTDCQIPETGEAGKCCRDSNYVDPWPVNLAGVCASRNKNTKPVGIADIDANFAEIPWQAMILQESTKTLLCGGSIIGDQFVLTTASCVQGVSVNDVRVKAGEWQLGSTDEPMPFQLVGAKTITVHPDYNPSTGSQDQAIISLDKRLVFSPHIQPICISDEDPKTTEQCITTGWGKQALRIHQEGAIMHRTDTTTQSRSECGADARSVCNAPVFDACEFDAGSALACGSGSSARLKGIYATETACGEGQSVRFTKPDVKWINEAFAQKNKPLLLQRN